MAMTVLGVWKFSTMGRGAAFVPIACPSSQQQPFANTWAAEMEEEQQQTSNMAEGLGPHGQTTLSALSSTARSGNVSQTPGILSPVITEPKRPTLLALVIRNAIVYGQTCALTYACTYGHHSNYFVSTCYLVYIISSFIKMAATFFFFVYIIDLNE